MMKQFSAVEICYNFYLISNPSCPFVPFLDIENRNNQKSFKKLFTLLIKKKKTQRIFQTSSINHLNAPNLWFLKFMAKGKKWRKIIWTRAEGINSPFFQIAVEMQQNENNFFFISFVKLFLYGSIKKHPRKRRCW